MPATANFFTQTPGIRNVAKLVAGYAQQRAIPPFAPETFKQWFARRGERNRGKPPVILWADTFNNHFTPAVAKAAVEVLESAGFHVRVPRQPLCCGRPLYDYGMLDTARGLLQDTVRALRDPIRDGVPVVGLEPSCTSVFRDELTNLLHGDADAERLAKQSVVLSEFLHDRVPGYQPPQLHRKAVVHGHCHHKSELHFDGEVALLKRAGVECELPDSGCCGMAGSFGYEADHYATGLACGERVLLPAVRSATSDTLVVADGFSCREMIHQETNRRALHVAQVLQMALREGPAGASDPLPETRYAVTERTAPVPVPVIAAAIAAGAGIWMLSRRRVS
jgi:Fe-S oxidoreductase